MAREDLHFRLRIPAAEKEWVAQRAAQNLRSMTAEINMIIRDAKRRAEFRGEAATGVGLGNQTPAAALNSTALQGGPINPR